MNQGSFKKGEKRPNQGKRGPSKTTLDARQAIAAFVDGNAHRLTGWLDQVAVDNPAKAFEMFQSVVEYHIPKLARQEVSGPDGSAIKFEINQPWLQQSIQQRNSA
jgi:hypothetical protein